MAKKTKTKMKKQKTIMKKQDPKKRKTAVSGRKASYDKVTESVKKTIKEATSAGGGTMTLKTYKKASENNPLSKTASTYQRTLKHLASKNKKKR